LFDSCDIKGFYQFFKLHIKYLHVPFLPSLLGVQFVVGNADVAVLAAELHNPWAAICDISVLFQMHRLLSSRVVSMPY